MAGERVQPNYNPVQEVARVTASPNRLIEKAKTPAPSPAEQLYDALKSAEPHIKRFNDNREKRLEEEQSQKIQFYREVATQQAGGKAVSAAQVGEIFPETVDIIRMRVAGESGFIHGKKQYEEDIQSILQNEELRNDPVKTCEFIEQKRKERLASLEGADDFYRNGYVKAMDGLQNQYEHTWAVERAHQHEQIQREGLSEHVTNIVADVKDPAELSRRLSELDLNWKATSSLNNKERNKVVVDTIFKTAFSQRNPDLLDAIPQRFRNAEVNANIEKTKIQILDSQLHQVKAGDYLRDRERNEHVYQGKQEILGLIVDGKVIDLGKYRNEPELYDYAKRMMATPRMDESQSIANSNLMRREILNFSTVEGGRSQEAWQKEILSSPLLNPAEKQALLQELPKLMEGHHLMNQPMVRQQYEDHVAQPLSMLDQSIVSRLQKMNGINLRSEMSRLYDNTVRNEYLAYYQDNGDFPRGKAALDILDGVVAKVNGRVKELTDIRNLSEQPATPAGIPANPRQPVAAPAQTQGVQPQEIQGKPGVRRW